MNTTKAEKIVVASVACNIFHIIKLHNFFPGIKGASCIYCLFLDPALGLTLIPVIFRYQSYQTVMFVHIQVCPGPGGNKYTSIVCPVNVTQQPEGSLPDIQSTEYAIQFLSNYSRNQKHGSCEPFFLAVGYHKPHIPLKYPKEFLGIFLVNNAYIKIRSVYYLVMYVQAVYILDRCI